jgi:hypothetical protein
LLLALPASQGQARAQDEKEPPPGKKQYDALLKDYATQQRELLAEVRKLKGDEQRKLLDKYLGLGKEFAEKFYKLAADNPKSPFAADALTWALQNGTGSPAQAKAATLLLEEHPDHPALERVCNALANARPPYATAALKIILEKSARPRVKAAAALALGKQLVARTDTLGDKLDEANKVAAEAEKYLARVVDEFGEDNPALKRDAEKELKAFRVLRVGKAAPEITAADLDEKEFKLSDYRGKVVLLDFWGNW